MGFLGSAFKFISDATSGAIDDMVMSKAKDLRRSPLLEKIENRASFGSYDDFELSNYVRKGEYLSLFYAYALKNGANHYNLSKVFKDIFKSNMRLAIRQIKGNCTSSNHELARLAMEVLETLKTDYEVKNIIKQSR